MRIKLLALSVLAGAILADSARGDYVFVSSFNASAIVEFDTNGNFITNFGHASLTNPEGLAFNASSLYAANNTGGFNNAGSVTEFDPSRNAVGNFGVGLGNPTGLAIDSAGNVYVASYNANAIVEFDSNGNFVTNFGHANLNNPEGMAFNSAGDLYVVNNTGGFNNAGNVTEFDPNHNLITTFGVGLGNPTGIAIDSAGNVYVASYNANAIVEFDSNGNFITNFGHANLSNPMGMAFDSAGNLFVANYTGGFNNAGSITEFDDDQAFLRNFGVGLGNPTFLAISPTPEPSSCVLLALGAFGFLARAVVVRRRSRG